MKPTPTHPGNLPKNSRAISSWLGVIMAIAAASDAAAQVSPRAEVRTPATLPGDRSLFAEDKGEKAAPAPKRAKGPTEIVALEATFDQKSHMAVFTGEVVVTDPEFTVQSDKLTAYLKNADKATAEAPTPGRLRPPGSADSKVTDKRKSSGLERAIAEADPGRVVTVTQEKKELDGSTSNSVGHGRKIVFDSVTGDITLTGRPDVQQGFNTCVATDDSTVMVLNRDGHMRVTGPHKTVIKDSGELNK